MSWCSDVFPLPFASWWEMTKSFFRWRQEGRKNLVDKNLCVLEKSSSSPLCVTSHLLRLAWEHFTRFCRHTHYNKKAPWKRSKFYYLSNAEHWTIFIATKIFLFLFLFYFVKKIYRTYFKLENIIHIEQTWWNHQSIVLLWNVEQCQKNNSQKKRCSSEGHNCLHPVYPHHYALYTACWSLLFTYTYFLHLNQDNVRNYYKGLVTEAMAFYFHLKWQTFLGERGANLKSWNSSTHSTK